jgi:DNA-binding PadR family transcriptional regulator
MESEGWISSEWEPDNKAVAAQRPARKYYRITRAGSEVLEASQQRYPLLGKLAASRGRR